RRFPELTFYFQPADIVSQILNFGLPAPIDVQVAGRDRKKNHEIAVKIAERLRGVRGLVDVHLHQVVSVPKLHVDVDQNRALELGMTQDDVARSVLVSLSGSGQVQPNYWVDPANGISYLVETRTPTHNVDSLSAIATMPLSAPGNRGGQLLANVAKVERGTAAEVVNHANVQPVYDVFANVQGRDLGGVAREVEAIVQEYRGELSPGNTITIRGQAESMRSAFVRLGLGIAFAA